MDTSMNENDYANISQNRLPQVPERCRVGFKRYTVVPGDTMNSIAKKYNVSVEFLKAENPHITDPNKIYPGDVLCVPPPPSGEGRVPESCPLGYERYTVKSGDTVNKISKELGVRPDLIFTNNPHIPDPNVIFPGDVLCVPVPLVFPSCSILKPANQAPKNAFGCAMVQKLADGQHQLVIIGVNLPNPSSLGNFDMYFGFVGIPGIGGYGFGLSYVPNQTSGIWVGSIILLPLLSVGNQIYVVPGNSQIDIQGKPILTGLLGKS